VSSGAIIGSAPGLSERIIVDPLPARHYGPTDTTSMSDTYPTSRSCYAVHYLVRLVEHLLVVSALEGEATS
jgi:hypothetical protein